MILLQEAIAAGPYLLLAFVLVIIGICVLIYFLFAIKRTNRKIEKQGSEKVYLKGVRNGLVVFSMIILVALILFVNWLCNIKFD